MKTYQILLFDPITKELKKVENFKPKENVIKEIKSRLYELQLEYCEDEYPTVEETIFTSNGVEIKTIRAFCDVDYEYICPIRKI